MKLLKCWSLKEKAQEGQLHIKSHETNHTCIYIIQELESMHKVYTEIGEFNFVNSL